MTHFCSHETKQSGRWNTIPFVEYSELTYQAIVKTFLNVYQGQFKKLQELRPISPSTKYLIAVGGWNHGPGNFQATVVDPAKRQRFVESSVAFCRKYGFDGLDIDWEYQDDVGGTVEQKVRENYRYFL